MKKFAGKNILITGVSSGLGKDLATFLASQNFKVFVTLRDLNLKNVFENFPNIECFELDVCNEDSIKKAFLHINKSVGIEGLDVLINNAGIVITGPLEFLKKEEIFKQFDVNVFGLISMCQNFIPLLKITKGKIINIGSMSNRMSIPFIGAYGASKAALKQISWALRLELKHIDIDVFHFELGNFPSAMWQKTDFDDNELESKDYSENIKNIKEMMKSRVNSFNSIDLLLKKTLQTINNKNRKFNTVIGKDAKVRRFVTTFFPYNILENNLLKIINNSKNK